MQTVKNLCHFWNDILSKGNFNYYNGNWSLKPWPTLGANNHVPLTGQWRPKNLEPQTNCSSSTIIDFRILGICSNPFFCGTEANFFFPNAWMKLLHIWLVNTSIAILSHKILKIFLSYQSLKNGKFPLLFNKSLRKLQTLLILRHSFQPC